MKYVVYLYILLFFAACNELNPFNSTRKPNLVEYNQLISDVKNNNLSISKRIKSADEAIAIAKKSTSDSLIFSSYQYKTNLLTDKNLKASLDTHNRKIVDWAKINPNYLAEATYNYAQFFNSNEKYDSAFAYYYQAKNYFNNEKNINGVVKCKTNIANILIKNGEFFKAKDIAETGLEIINKKDTLNKIAFEQIKANANYNLTFYNEAIESYKQILSLAPKNSLLAIETKAELAIALLETNRYEDATILIDEIINDKLFENNPKIQTKVLELLAYSEWQEYRNQSITIQLQDALKLANENKLYSNKISILNHLINIYKEIDTKKALIFSELMYDVAKEINNNESQIEALKNIILLNPSIPKNELENYIYLSDQLNLKRKEKQNSLSKIQYETESHFNLSKIIQNPEQNKISIQRSKIVMFIILIWFVIALIIFWFYSNLNQKKTKQMQLTAIYETEVNLSQKLHDELANSLYSTINLVDGIDFENEQIKEKLIKNLDHIYTQTRTISRDTSTIDLTNFEDDLQAMISSYADQSKHIITKGIGIIVWENLHANTKITIFRVILELLTNMKKHSDCTLVVLKFEFDKDNLNIQYKDNGTTTQLINNSSTNGLKNVENRIGSINGTINFDLSKGFNAFIQIPKSML